MLGLRFCVRAFFSCGERGPLFIAVCRPLTVAASLVAGHRLQTHRVSSCDSWDQLLRGMWDLPRPGLEPVSPALAGRFSTTAPPGKPHKWSLTNKSEEIFFTISPPLDFNFLLKYLSLGKLQVGPMLCHRGLGLRLSSYWSMLSFGRGWGSPSRLAGPFEVFSGPDQSGPWLIEDYLIHFNKSWQKQGVFI